MSPLLTLFAATCDRSGGFFGLIPWWQYLPASDFGSAASNTGACNIVHFDLFSVDGIPLILLAVIDDLLRIGGILAIGYALYGAVLYITSQGSPAQTAKAQETLINALIGVAIATVAVAFVSFLGSKLGG